MKYICRIYRLFLCLGLVVLLSISIDAQAAESKQFELAENEHIAEVMEDETADDSLVEISDEEVPLAIEEQQGTSPLVWVFVGMTGAIAGSIYLRTKTEE